MKPLALIILFLTIALGTYFNSFDQSKDKQALIEDSVGSSMAAPIKANIPL